MASPSQVFRPYRAIGICSNHVPLVAQSQGSEVFLVTAVGKSFHVYLCDKLRLIFVGSQQPHPLQCLAISGKRVFASYKSTIKAFRRGQEVNCYQGDGGDVHTLIPFGEHLVAIDNDNCLRLWHINTQELYSELHLPKDTLQVTCCLHPATYLNKLLLGGAQGGLQLWNLRTSTLIYTFQGWGSKVASLAQSQAVDVVGIGLENGNVLVHNVRLDETVMRFHQEWGPVTAIAFRTDHVHTMATASPTGDIAVWDQERRRLGTILRGAHQGAVTGLQFVQSRPFLLTSGPDNSVKVWVFDQSDGGARLLRSRCGHNAPPTRIRFCSTGGDAVKILSGGLDNALRVFAMHKDVHMNMELSQGHLTKKSRTRGVMVEDLKLPAVTDFTTETARAREWGGVVSCHLGHSSAQTWNLHNACIGDHTLRSKHAKQGARPQCVALSGCGHYAVLGMSSGHVEIFNMQSGIHRGEIGKPRAHAKAVRGVAVDALTMEVYTGSADGTVKFWSFPTKSLLHSISLEFGVSSLTLHRDSSMLCVVSDDFTILIVDADTKRVVRTFRGHSNRITDTTFSADGRWLISSGMDCSIRTWDLPTGRLLDVFLVEAPPTSIALSPSGDFLCSSHVDDLGIYLWSNRTLYSHVSLRPLPSDHTPSFVALPNTAVSLEAEEAQDKENREDFDLVSVEMDSDERTSEEGVSECPHPLSEDLVTLSTLPKSRWYNLQQLDVIKQHNKPKQPPKQPKKAPFFLPTTAGLQPKFTPTQDDELAGLEGAGSRILNLGGLVPLSDFQKTLQCCAEEERYDPMMDLLKNLPPAAIDGEIRSLAPDNGGSCEYLQHFMEFLLSQLKTNMNFELVEAYMGLFLKLHSGVVGTHPHLTALVEQLLDAHTSTWKQLQSDMDMSACLLGYFRSATV